MRSAADLRRWLGTHHAQSRSVWLVTFKKHTGVAYLPTSAVLDKLLCFGWVDGLARKLDADSTMQLISPRQANAWTKIYRDRAARLEREGRVQPPGRAAIAMSQAMGFGWLNSMSTYCCSRQISRPPCKPSLLRTPASSHSRLRTVATSCAGSQRLSSPLRAQGASRLLPPWPLKARRCLSSDRSPIRRLPETGLAYGNLRDVGSTSSNRTEAAVGD